MNFLRKHFKGINYIFYSFCIVFGVISTILIGFQISPTLTNIDIAWISFLSGVAISNLIISIIGIVVTSKGFSKNWFYNLNNLIIILISLITIVDVTMIGQFEPFDIIALITAIIVVINSTITLFIKNDEYPFIKLMLSSLSVILSVFVTCFLVINLQEDIFNFIRGCFNIFISIALIFPVIGISEVEESTH